MTTSHSPDDEIARLRTDVARLQAQLEEATQIVESAFDAYIGIDRHGRVIAWNRQAERTFGWTREEMLGRDMAERIIPLHLRPSHARGLARYLATGDGPALNRRIEVTALHHDGRIFPIEMTIWPVGSGATLRFNAFLHDVSERAAAVQRLAVQKAVAISLLGATRLRDVAHDMLAALGQSLDWDVAVLWLPDGENGLLHRAAYWHRPDHTFPAYATATATFAFAPGEALPGRVAAGRAPLWLSDLAKEDHFPRCAAARDDGLHAALAFPILDEARCLGVVECASVRTLAADELMLETMRVLGHLLGQFVVREQAQEACARRG